MKKIIVATASALVLSATVAGASGLVPGSERNSTLAEARAIQSVVEGHAAARMQDDGRDTRSFGFPAPQRAQGREATLGLVPGSERNSTLADARAIQSVVEGHAAARNPDGLRGTRSFGYSSQDRGGVRDLVPGSEAFDDARDAAAIRSVVR